MEIQNYFIVSDLKGADLVNRFCQCTSVKKSITCKECKCIIGVKDKIIICGKVTDSTTSQPEHSKTYMNRSKNLSNLIEINNNENISLVVGNRDLNKIKLLLLGKLNNQYGDKMIAKFNDGSIDITYESYLQLLNKTKSAQKGGKFTFVKDSPEIKSDWKEDVKDWPIFWENVDYTKWEDLPTRDDDTFKDTTGFFFNRYYDVFVASMGSPYMLFTIPNELSIDINIGQMEMYDYYAFIVFVIYNSLLNLNIDTNVVV
jgi:hypothetical protein